MTLKLDSRPGDIKGVGGKYLEILKKNGLATVGDLLLHFPIYYIDLSTPRKHIDLEQKGVYLVEIENFKLTRIFGKKLSVLKVNARIDAAKVQLTFFNKPYLVEFLKKNKRACIYARPEKTGDILQVSNPMIFAPDNRDKVLPIYTNISSLKSGKLRKIIENIFISLEDDSEFLPAPILKQYGFRGIVDSMRRIHLPEKYSQAAVERSKHRFVYAEFLLFQLELQYIRNFYERVARCHHYVIGPGVREAQKKSLEFELTPDQIRAYEDIVNDLKAGFTMQRLLQGDVGSGKTVVAFMALLLAKENGFQGAMLAPTEILANQHFANGKRFFKDARIALLTGSTPDKTRKEIQNRLKQGEIDIIFGTHALLSENVAFKKLSLVVIDEQHRFGVSQRAALYYKGNSVDLLVTTATPIPRTMLLSLYNDLSVSLIKTKPRGRLPIITKIIPQSRRDEFYHWLRKKIAQKEKAYIILPLIEDSEFFPALKSIETEAQYFKEIFTGIPLDIVSGKTPADSKEKILRDFASGTGRVLVSTTVVELGIDVKDATYMVIEDADKYGLAQLHQLRGRVGRGERQSYCYLVPSTNITGSGKQRLETIAATNDGFKIAETDLEMRGGGLVTGQEQSGFLDFKIGDVKKDQRIFKAAQRDAAALLKNEALQNDYISGFLEKVRRKIQTLNFS